MLKNDDKDEENVLSIKGTKEHFVTVNVLLCHPESLHHASHYGKSFPVFFCYSVLFCVVKRLLVEKNKAMYSVGRDNLRLWLQCFLKICVCRNWTQITLSGYNVCTVSKRLSSGKCKHLRNIASIAITNLRRNEAERRAEKCMIHWSTEGTHCPGLI